MAFNGEVTIGQSGATPSQPAWIFVAELIASEDDKLLMLDAVEYEKILSPGKWVCFEDPETGLRANLIQEILEIRQNLPYGSFFCTIRI
jgi:hypothetical protein